MSKRLLKVSRFPSPLRVTHSNPFSCLNNQHDTHIISILYKTHRSLSPKSVQKVNSLYTFNALATTAKTMVDKGVARKGDPNAELGAGFATGFLNKMEGVLEGLIDDMVDGWVEGQVSPSSTLFQDV